MHRPAIDFIRPAGPGRLGVGLLVAGGLLLAAAGMDLADRRQAAADLDARVAGLEKRLQDVRGESRKPAADPAADKALAEARKVVEALDGPWDDLFLALEAAQDRNVALLAVIPDRGAGKVALTGEAKDYPALVGYLQRLEATGALVRPELLNHEVKGAQNQVVFSALAALARGTGGMPKPGIEPSR